MKLILLIGLAGLMGCSKEQEVLSEYTKKQLHERTIWRPFKIARADRVIEGEYQDTYGRANLADLFKSDNDSIGKYFTGSVRDIKVSYSPEFDRLWQPGWSTVVTFKDMKDMDIEFTHFNLPTIGGTDDRK